MEGFLAYRERTEVDFADADLFVLSGPTGSGKSSVIDGMTFALYGTIPRLDDRRSVAPVISAMSDRARVSFRFSVGDETYLAVRLVERRGAGATTTEARLERVGRGEPLAGSADEVTAEVTELLGLTYDHFTKAVVLPQGAFADFLTDRPKDRQALLRALLEIGLFEQVMQIANARARTSEGKIEVIGESLAKLDVPTPEQIEQAQRRLDLMVGAGEELHTRLARLRQHEEVVARAKTAQSAASEALARLESVSAPPGLDHLERDRAAARANHQTVAKSLATILDARRAIDEDLAGRPGPERLQSWQADQARLTGMVASRDALDLEGLSAVVEESVHARDEARTALDIIRREHTAHDLRAELVVGQACPVCLSPVTDLPDEGDGSHESIDQLVDDLRRLDVRASESRDRLKEAQGQAKQIDQGIGDLEGRLDGAPDPELVASELAAVTELIGRRAESDEMQAKTRAEIDAAALVVDRLGEQVTGLRENLIQARDRVAGEDPPIPGDDVVESWRAFERWRLSRVVTRTTEVERLAGAVEEAAEAGRRASVELRSWLESLHVELTDSPETDLALAIERRGAEIEELEKTVAHAVELGEELELETARARVSSALGTHLRSNNFEAWLLEEALEALVAGANRLLEELTGGAYSLVARDSQFEVIDHRNADISRTTRGLSGGETFLVALSLSLAMAEQLAALTGMSSRLESILLDEGFGSLDQESLDVVASVLEELVGRGRTVGIVTHVRDLAERMPVRFEVSKGVETASIEKVLA
jgi:exonuclease SbcC